MNSSKLYTKSTVRLLSTDSFFGGSADMTNNINGNTYHIRIRPESMVYFAANMFGTTHSSKAANR